jgi:hypothetical protein
MAETSLLFEWISPTNEIILKYPQADLVLVGGIRHQDLCYLRLTELQEVATHLGTPLVEFFRLNPQGWAELYATLATDTEREGYVVRVHAEQTLVKVKCAPYLAKHAFKYSMSTGKLVDLWLQAGRPSEKDFLDELSHQFDEETIMWALPFISNLFRWVQAVQEHTALIQQDVERHRALARKDFAIRMRQQLRPRDFTLAILLLDGKGISDRLMRQLLEEESAATGGPSPAAEES